MTRLKKKITNLTKKSNRFYFLTLLIMTLILIGGIQSAYAYYYKDTESLPILSNLVGDFDSGNGDINIIIYKETGVDNEEFVKTYSIPEVGYSFNIDKLTCKNISGTKIICDKDNPNADCNYTYDEGAKEINLTSNQKVTCRFYFNKDYENDVELYIMMQDANGTYEHTEKKYRNVDSIPAYGFTFSGYSCQNGSTVEIDSETGKLKVLATQRDVCYAYYDGSLENADIIANVYVQKVVGGDYIKVSTIPGMQRYKISTTKESYCHTPDSNENRTSSVPTYENFYINIPESEQKQVCEVYLEIDNS